MKTKTKKFLTFILAVLCIVTLAVSFVACDAANTTTETTVQTEQQQADGTTPPAMPDGTTPPSGGQGGFPGGQQGGFPGGQQGGFPGGQQGGNNASASTVTTSAKDTSALEAEIKDFDYTLELEDVTSYEGLEVVKVDLASLAEDYVITESGNYVFTGETEYRIVLGAKNIEVHIWLENAKLDSIFSDKKHASTVITLVGEHEMTGLLSDADDDAKGTLYVKNDLLINGNGQLTISSGDGKNGVHVTGKLEVKDATLTIVAGKHGIRGNDAVVLLGATLNITAGTDGIQNDNEIDYADLEETYAVTYKYIYVEDSDITIVSGDDGISAANLLYIKSGDINVTTNGGAPSKITETSSDNADGKGLKAGSLEYEVTEDLLETELAKGDREDATDEDTDEGVKVVELTTADYYAIVIEGGNITINANDDAIHSNGNLFVNGGTLNITSGDDGIHAEEVLKVADGTIVINNCYEGIEAAKLEIAGGDITLTSQDDGLNAADGTNAQMGYVNQNCYIIISGGVLRVNAQGDGIDSNNAIYISGGEVYVDGPTNGGNSALDTEAGVVVDGGTLVAVGAVGMVETPSNGSAQNVIVYQATSTLAAGTTVTLKDANGGVVLEHTTAKTSQSVILSSDKLTSGATYTVYVNGTSAGEVTLSQAVSYLGTQGGNMGGMPGQTGGMQPGGRR